MQSNRFLFHVQFYEFWHCTDSSNNCHYQDMKRVPSITLNNFIMPLLLAIPLLLLTLGNHEFCVSIDLSFRAMLCVFMFSCLRLFVTPWTVAHPLSVGLPSKNTGMGCHFLLQGIFPTQGSNVCFLHLLHWRADSLPPSHLGSPSSF